MVLLPWSGHCFALHGYAPNTNPSKFRNQKADATGFISLSHEHKEFDGQRIDKRYRIPVRFVVALVLICLPLADNLSSLQLISTTTSLVVLTLGVDVYGGTSVHEDFWKCTRQCKYRADCPLKRRILLEAVKDGTTIKLDEM